MAGMSKNLSFEEFKPNLSVDQNRTWQEKRANWRDAEAKVLGKRFVQAKERELEARERQQEIIKKKTNVSA